MYGNNCIFMAIKENFDFDIQETFENSKRKKLNQLWKYKQYIFDSRSIMNKKSKQQNI